MHVWSSRAVVSGGPKAAGVHMCTFHGSGLQKHHQNSTKGPPESEERKKIVAGEGKRSEILGPAEGGPAEGGPLRAVRRRGGPVEEVREGGGRGGAVRFGP